MSGSASCTAWNTGYSSNAGSAVCNPIWGDGMKQTEEGWDDGNLNDGDGWSSTCTVEDGFSCIGGSPSAKDIWGEVCGDGKVIHDTEENWDDSNLIDGDGWSSICTVERGWVWNGGTSISHDIWRTQWGDGIILPPIEEWDDKNVIQCSKLSGPIFRISFNEFSKINILDNYIKNYFENLSIRIYF